MPSLIDVGPGSGCGSEIDWPELYRDPALNPAPPLTAIRIRNRSPVMAMEEDHGKFFGSGLMWIRIRNTSLAELVLDPDPELIRKKI